MRRLTARASRASPAASGGVQTRRSRRPVWPRRSAARAGPGSRSTSAADRVGDVGVAETVEPPEREVGLACRARATRSRRRGRAAGAADRAEAQRRRRDGQAPRCRHARRATRAPARSSLDQRRRLAGRRAVHAEPDRRAGVEQRRCTGRCPAPRRPLELGQCATPVPVAASARDRRRRPGARSARARRRRRASRASSRYSTGVQPNVSRQNSSSSAVSARWVCSRTPRRAGQLGRLAHQLALTENGEQGASAIRSIEPGDGSW